MRNIATTNREWRANRIPLVLVLCLASIRGLLYTSLVPPWGHYDEPTHFEYAWLIANRASLPQRGDYDQDVRREIAASMLEFRFFRDASAQVNLLAQDRPAWIGISELSHPPLYYALVALPLRLFRHAGVVFQLYIARLVSLLLYLTSIWIGHRVTGELVAPGHPLRWVVPGVMALHPAYTDLMTAVNSDVGAVVVFSLFLWGAVRTIARRPSLAHIAWVVGTAALCAWTKNTASLAVILLPVVLAFALVRRAWHGWWWIAVLGVGISVLLALFSWGDAASWYRATQQATTTSQRVDDAPLGRRAIALELGGQSHYGVFQHPSDQEVEALRGVTVTLGAWIWATQPTAIRSPALYDGPLTTAHRVQVGVEPAFYTTTATISANADHIVVSLRPLLEAREASGAVVYYDGVVLAEGIRRGAPLFGNAEGRTGTWEGQPFTNLVRNGSAEFAGPRMRTWIDVALQKYSRRWPSQFLISVLDWEYTGWVYKVTSARLLQSFWARFGWNQTGLSDGWYGGLGVLTVLGMVGTSVAWLKACRLGRPMPWMRAVGLLALAAVILWGNAFLRAHPVYPNSFLPVARYAYPAIIPTVLALASGWWAITPRRFRRWFSLAIFSVLGVLDVVSLWTVTLFFYRS